MSELPAGWRETRLGTVLLDIEGGRSFECESRPAGEDEWGVVKVSAMTWGRFDPTENKAVRRTDQVNQAFEIHPGDLLISRANTVEYVGAIVLVDQTRPRLLLSDKSLRLRPAADVDRRWLLHVLRSREVRKQIEARATGTKDSMRNISQATIRDLRIPLPPFAEQQRIVAAIEEEFSRIDAGTRQLEAGRKRLHRFRANLLNAAVQGDLTVDVPEAEWRTVILSEVAEVRLGRQRSPKNHVGPQMRPYLRAANVTWDGLALGDVKQMNFSDAEARVYRLKPGDIVLGEASGSREEVGKPALWRGEIDDCCFQNTLLRVRATDADPNYLLIHFQRDALLGRFAQAAKGVGIHHLGAQALSSWPVRLPSLEVQRRIVTDVESILTRTRSVGADIEDVRERTVALRATVLADGFAGRLAR